MSDNPMKNKNIPTGINLLHNPVWNKGTGFSEEEREVLKIRGLLPPRVFSESEQALRIMENFKKKPTPLEKYIYLISLQDRNETLFYRILIDHIDEMMPIVYTPTVGEACQKFDQIFRRPRGLYISTKDRGSMKKIIENWPEEKVGIIVVTDGERILGLGDQGTNGMGIPIGKLTLYTACAGVNPNLCLPIMLDVGTNNEDLLKDPLYLGEFHHRLYGEEYDDYIEEFVQAVQEVHPEAIIQFEDFSNRNAFRLLEKYRDRVCSFNDDIQGTASVALSGIYSSLRITKSELRNQRVLFFGAGEAGLGIGSLIVNSLVKDGFDENEARKLCWYVDSRGLVVKDREKITRHKAPFAHDHLFIDTLLDAIHNLKPTILIGASGQPQTFTQDIIEAMTEYNKNPVIFALSNPTSKSECTAEQAYKWSKGKAIFASGSPFDPVEINGKTHVPGQGNNAYVFPGIGLGAIVSESSRITDDMFVAAAQTLSQCVTEEDLEKGRLYPDLTRIREVSSYIARAVAIVAYESDLTENERPKDLLKVIKSHIYEPNYYSYV
ncbi:MAG: NAD-dependent malic enzyme [Candidatus Marinimicrobia bacterium]|nr:NAD-dependent malic enzyme [Candidatus Neomarinimicrobiota bacterium]